MDIGVVLSMFGACTAAVVVGNATIALVFYVIIRKTVEDVMQKERQTLEKYTEGVLSLKDAMSGIKDKKAEEYDFTVPYRKPRGDN